MGLFAGVLILLIVSATIVTWLAMKYRRVVPTNMVHIVQTKQSSTPYGRGKEAGNIYYEWPHWVPALGVSVTTFPESIFQVELDEYEAYDEAKVPFVVDVIAFFRVDNAEIVAQRISNFEELNNQLRGVLQGAVRRVLSTNLLEDIMQARATLGQQFTQEVQEQIREWGVLPVKTIEFMDIRDSNKGGNVIANIMAREKSRIEKESRTAVALNLQEAETKEIEARRNVELQRQEAEQLVGVRTAGKDQQVGIANQEAKQQVLSASKITAEKEMEVARVQQVKSAEIAKDVAVVGAEQAREVLIVKTTAQKESTVIEAEGKLEAAQKNAQGIEVEGKAKGSAEQAMLMAPINTQISLAKEIGENQGYQHYLVTIKQVEANRDVGLEMARAFSAADLKIIANSSDIGSGVGKLTDIISSAGGVNLGAMLEGLSQTDKGKEVLDAFVNRVDGTKK